MSKEKNKSEIQRLKKQLKEQKELNENLKQEIELLYFEIGKLIRNRTLDKVLNEYQGRVFGAAAADLLLDSPPVELKCTGEKADTTEIYSVAIKNILAIGSRKRSKDIYLSQPLSSNSGSKAKSIIIFDDNNVNFDELLFLIQRKGHHLLRVHKSYAVNIHYYVLGKKKTFCLVDRLKTETNKVIHEIPVDAHFDKKLYQERLFEIDKLKEGLGTVALDFRKIKEINDLKAELGIS